MWRLSGKPAWDIDFFFLLQKQRNWADEGSRLYQRQQNLFSGQNFSEATEGVPGCLESTYETPTSNLSSLQVGTHINSDISLQSEIGSATEELHPPVDDVITCKLHYQKRIQELLDIHSAGLWVMCITDISQIASVPKGSAGIRNIRIGLNVYTIRLNLTKKGGYCWRNLFSRCICTRQTYACTV